MELVASGLHAMLYNAAIGVMVLAVYGFLPVSCNEECTSSAATLRLQSSCKQEDEDLTSAHSNEDSLEICRNMAVMFKCAVVSLPGCYDYLETTIFNMYFHSPFSCELTEQQIIELQSIHNRGTHVDAQMLTTSSTRISTETYSEEDSANITHASVSTDTYQYVAHTLPKESEAGNIPCEYGCQREEEQRGRLENNGASQIVSRKIPLLVLVVLWSRSLSWRLMS